MTDLHIVSGLPYSRRIRVVDGVNVWPTLQSVEVKSHVRVSQNSTSTLKSDLTPYLTKSIDGNDIVIDFAVSGLESRNLKGGYYDIVLHDPSDVDARGIVLVSGQVFVERTVTEVSYAG